MIYAEPRRKRRIRLVNPDSPLSTITKADIVRRMTFSRRAIFAPTGLTICAAVLPDHWEAEIIDETVQSKPHVPSDDCDIVGLSVMTTQAHRAYELADAYRRLGVTVIMGGIHPSAMPDDALPHCDAICKGDAESTLPHLIADYDRGIEQGGDDRKGRENLKRIYDWAEYPTADIATPRKDLLNPKDYLIANPIQTTRGCPHGCNFCTTPGVFGRKFRQREIADIVEEIREAKERFNSSCFIFADDNFAGNQKWAIEMCAAIEPLKVSWASQCDILISRDDKLLAAMKRSGCSGLILGLESRKQDTLSEAGKRFVKSDSYEWRIRKIHSHRISLWGAFIFGFDHDTWQDMMHTCRWAQRTNLSMSCYPILTPYPGTGFFEQFEREGRLITRNWERYNGASIVFEPQRMTPKMLRHAQMAAFAEFYSIRSSLQRLKFLPFKKHAWMANLAIGLGISYYYARRGRRVPSFRDFLDPGSKAWNYADPRDELRDEAACCDMPSIANLAVAEADPMLQMSRSIAALDADPTRD